MDFSKYDLTPELLADIEADYKDDVAGLKSKNADLLAKLSSEKDELEKQRKAAHDAEVAKATQEKDSQRLVELKAQELEAKNKELQIVNDRLQAESDRNVELQHGRLMDKFVAEVSKSVLPEHQGLVGHMLRNSATFSKDESGNTIERYTLGDQSFTNVNDYVAAFKQDKSMSGYTAQSNSSGGGGSGNTGTGGKKTKNAFQDFIDKRS